ncbi:g1437 [Coccomyxa elongata]
MAKVYCLTGGHLLARPRLARAEFRGSVLFSRRAQRCLGRGRSSVVIENNELNKWGDTDARDDDSDLGVNEDDLIFASDTAKIVARVLTSRAVQKVLLQLQETDLFVAHWFSEYCSANPPMTGDKFVLELLKQRPLYATDKINGKDHYISPPMLANRVMVAREALAGGMSKFDFPTYMARTNTEVYRKHLESSSYTSGSYAKAERRRKQQP